MFDEITINGTEAIAILHKDESHFLDFVDKTEAGHNVQRKCCSFANSDGGELFIGIIDKKNAPVREGTFGRWNGFSDDEEANSVIQNTFLNIKPNIGSITYEFIKIKDSEDFGKILKVNIEKSQQVHETANGKTYIRRGAQCFEIFGNDIINLKLSKGIMSFEDQSLNNYEINRLIESEELNNFLQDYSPKTEPKIFLKKQVLLDKDDRPKIAGVLLYDENPSIVIPKKCSIKISRYDTSEEVPERDHLKRQETIEGSLYQQIQRALEVITAMIETVPVLGPSGLEKAKYPPEAINEILVNAIIHRDYNISDDILVFVYNNRIEVHSPGPLAGHVTIKNILDERFARNPKIVRLLNKYPNPPNKDIGEGLNTTFQKMNEVRLKEPKIINESNKVIVTLPHESLASPEEQILKYLETNDEINNSTARELTGVKSENAIKRHFYSLNETGKIERVPGRGGSKSAWQLKK